MIEIEVDSLHRLCSYFSMWSFIINGGGDILHKTQVVEGITIKNIGRSMLLEILTNFF